MGFFHVHGAILLLAVMGLGRALSRGMGRAAAHREDRADGRDSKHVPEIHVMAFRLVGAI